VLAAWNGLAISAFARAASVLGRPDLGARAAAAATFVLTHMRRDGRLSRIHRPGGGARFAFVEDYACIIAGLLDLYEARGEPAWLAEAAALQATLDRHYWDDDGGGYYRTSDDHEKLLVREKPDHDGAEPAGSSVALLNLLRLHALTLDDRYRSRADRLVEASARVLSEQPTALGEMLLGLDFALASPVEVLIVAPDPTERTAALVRAARRAYAPASVLAVATMAERAEHERLVPAFRGKVAIDGRATAYVCRAGACRLPITDPDRLADALADREDARRPPGDGEPPQKH
jgi:uncharacterized protein YyaL (SSP411 family)